MWTEEDPNEGWLVRLAVPAEEGKKILDEEDAPRDGVFVLLADPDGDVYELLIYSREDNTDRARAAAIDVYYRRRHRLGLEQETARVIGLTRPADYAPHGAPGVAVPLQIALMKEAERVLEHESHFEWAVVLAQSACEIEVRYILERWAEHLGGATAYVVKQLNTMDLANDRVRSAFEAITGHSPALYKPMWDDYLDHVRRRHRIVHTGARITRVDAEQSLEAAKSLIGWLAWPAVDSHSYRRKTL